MKNVRRAATNRTTVPIITIPKRNATQPSQPRSCRSPRSSPRGKSTTEMLNKAAVKKTHSRKPSWKTKRKISDVSELDFSSATWEKNKQARSPDLNFQERKIEIAVEDWALSSQGHECPRVRRGSFLTNLKFFSYL